MGYFYFDFKEPAKQNVSNLLRCLIYQLAEVNHDMRKEVQQLHEKFSITRPPVGALLDTLLSLLSGSHQQTYIIIDALDECASSLQGDELFRTRKELMQCVSRVSDHGASNLHLLVTSRDGTSRSEIDNVLKILVANQPHGYDISIKANDDDINKLIKSKIPDSWDDAALKEKIASTVIGRASGM